MNENVTRMAKTLCALMLFAVVINTLKDSAIAKKARA